MMEEFLEIEPARMREGQIIKVSNDPNKQFNPKTIRSIMAMPE